MSRSDRHVDLAGDGFVVEVGRPNHRQDLARRRPKGDQRAVGGMTIGERLDLRADRVLRHLLKFRVDRGVDGESGAVDGLRIVHTLELAAYELDPVREGDLDIGRAEDVAVHFGRGRPGLFGRDAHRGGRIADVDAALLAGGNGHEPEHLALAVQRRLAVAEDIVDGGGLDQPGQKRGL